MEITNVLQCHSEFIACGVNISSVDSDANIHFIEPDIANLAPLVLAAHEKPLSSDECLALEAELTPEQWLAYQECRKAPIKAQREARYRAECDPMRLKLDEDYDIGSENWLTGLAAWKSAKAAIREDLPYDI